MIKKFVGVNIAVKDLDEAARKFRAVLGVEPRPVTDPDQFAFPGLIASSFDLGGVQINLIASKGGSNPVEQFIGKRGEGVLLLSVMSDDIEKDIEDLAQKGIPCILPKASSGGYGKVNFIHPKTMNGVQIELLEPPHR